MTPQPAISIVMPARNEGERVAQAVRSFAAGRSAPFPLEFIIVDDASEDGCCDRLEDMLTWRQDSAWVHVVRLERWSGIPFARNRGAAEAHAPALLITDANVEAAPGWDIPVRRDLHPGRALCAVIADGGSHWRGFGCLLDLPSMGIRWLPHPLACGGFAPVTPCTGTVVPADLFRRLGGYDTAMPAYGAAEPEMSVRLWLSGAEIVVCPDLVLRHRFRPAAERRPFLDRIEALQVQNYLRFGLLYLDEAGTASLLSHYARCAPAHFAEALHRVEAGDVWERRRHLQERLPHDFGWYAQRFGLWQAADARDRAVAAGCGA